MRWAYAGFPTFCNEKKVIRTNNLQPQCCDQLRLDSAEFLKRRNRIRPLRLCFEGNVIEGSLSYLTYLFGRKWRPSPQCPALAATAGEMSLDQFLVEQIAAGSRPAMQALFARHRTYVRDDKGTREYACVPA